MKVFLEETQILSVGANGTITALRMVDSGFPYKNNELVRLKETTRDALQAAARLTLNDVANAEGY